MAKNDRLRCKLITPDRQVLDVEAEAVAFPAHDGEMGVLKNRAALLCKLGIGVCRITTGGQTKRYYVDGGFARMLDNRLAILTQEARSSEEIDRASAEQELAQARARSATDQTAQQERRKAIQRASAQIKAARAQGAS